MANAEPNPTSGTTRESTSLRQPPHSIAAEQYVIGALLLDEQAIIPISGKLQKEDFYRKEHALIYEAILALNNDGRNVDVVTVAEWLENRQLLDQCGGLNTIVSLAENTPVISNLESHADIVRKRSVLRQLLSALNTIGEKVYNPQGMEYSEILDIAERYIFEIAEREEKFRKQHRAIRPLLLAAMDHIGKVAEADSRITGLATGFTELDNKTAGLQPTDLIIIAGRPSMGKTALAINVAENACIQQKKSVAIFSMEMSAEQLAIRMLASLGHINQQAIRTGNLQSPDWERLSSVIELLSDARMFIDDTADITPAELRSRARRMKREENIDLIIIDYLQLIQSNSAAENRTTEIANISRALKNMAKELHVPVVVLSQLNRSLEQRPNKRPVMSDLRESGAIEQDADVILFVYRDEFYNPESTEKGIAEILLSKQRNGPTGKIKLSFRSQFTRFENYISEKNIPSDFDQYETETYS